MINQRTIFSLTGALVLGLVLAFFAWPTLERERAFRNLFSADEVKRRVACRYFGEIEHGGSGMMRLQQDTALAERIVARLQAQRHGETRNREQVFGDVVALLEHAGFWRVDFVPRDLYLQRVGFLLRLTEKEALRRVLNELLELAGTYAAGNTDDERDAIAGLYRALLAQAEVGSELRREAFAAAVRWLGVAGMGRGGIFESALNDREDGELRRWAWLTVGLLDPPAGFRADWENETDARVVEAILWATTVTNRDQFEPLRQAVALTPWRTTVLPWLLAKSGNAAALDILRGLQLDGNPGATIPLLEYYGEPGEVPARDAVRAFLGIGEAEEFIADAVLYRWYLWRRAEAHSFTRNDFRQVVSSPVAADGSVWAAVLLAERLLSAADAERLAANYLASFEAAEQRAGILLAGLLGQQAEKIEALAEGASAVEVKRTARLAGLLFAEEDEIELLDLVFAERLLNDATENADDESAVDFMLPMIAIKHEAGMRRLFLVEGSPGAHLLKYGWLLERFLPAGYERVAPLHPWRDSVAALQLDILRVAEGLELVAAGGTQ